MQIALALYPQFTMLDIIGPFQVLADVPGHEVVFVAAEAGPVVDHTGLAALTATKSFADVPDPDVVVVPGGLHDTELQAELIDWLRAVHPTTTWTTSVCTGGVYLAAAGILDGLDATTHWARKRPLEKLGAHYTTERVVERGKIITAAGVSSGIDMALTPPRSPARPRHGADGPTRHRVRPAAAVRRRLADQGPGRARRPRPTDDGRRPRAPRHIDLRRFPMSAQPITADTRAQLRAAWTAELNAARTARATGDTSGEWTHLERAHILSQPLAGPHVRTHAAMLAAALRRRDGHELVGQLFRIIVAAPGSITGKYPIGNTGGANVSAFEPMPIPDDLRPLLPDTAEAS